MIMVRQLARAAALATLVTALPALAAHSYTMTELLGPGRTSYDFLGTNAINESGQIAGYGRSGSSSTALVWDGLTATRIQPLGALESVANGINESGLVIGTATYEGGVMRAFTYDLGTGSFGDPFGAGSEGWALNDAGVLVGAVGAAPALRDPVTGLQTYALPSGIARARFRAITADGQLVVALDNGAGSRDVTGMASAAAALPAAPLDPFRNFDFAGANAVGQYSVNVTFPGAPFFIAYVLVGNIDGTLVADGVGLGRLPGDEGNYGGAFNDQLDFVGESYSENRNGGSYGNAIITTSDDGTLLLSSLVGNLGSAFLQQGKLINNSGTIVAFGFQDGHRATFVLTPDSINPSPGVPEPASWAMLVGGFGLLGGMMRRRRALTTA